MYIERNGIEKGPCVSYNIIRVLHDTIKNKELTFKNV